MIQEKNLVFVLISSTVVVFAWIGFSLYHTSVTSTLDDELTLQIKPIRPNFSPSIVNLILNREDIAPTYEFGGKRVATSPLESSNSAQENNESSETPTPSDSDIIEEGTSL